MNSIYIRLIDMPTSARGFTLPDPEGGYNIYINARMGQELRLRALQHELAHIAGQDFEKEDAAAVERAAHDL